MNPYESLPSKSYWKLAVANKSMFDICELWDPKFHIKKHQRIATFGSCFAQHIGNAMNNNGYRWFNAEPAPYGLLDKHAKQFSYNLFSARTGNIYTTSLLRQWTDWALGEKPIPTELWTHGDRYYDPFRPNIEPNGFQSATEAQTSLQHTVSAFKDCITSSGYFVFTLGLTESWRNTETGYEYPLCPGTVAGDFNDAKHQFKNMQFEDINTSLREAIATMRRVSPRLKFILTVSPVPLTATMSGKHVAVASMASKSVLRAVAESLSSEFDYVDYFPSYEIINSPIFRGVFFEPNQRSVNPRGVEFVINSFFSCLNNKFGAPHAATSSAAASNDDKYQSFCEEELLEAFAK